MADGAGKESAELANAMAQIKARWITGGSGLAHSPAAWRELIGEGEAAELNLLAMVGQATQVAFRPAPGGDLTLSQPLPRLAAPPLPEAARARFRRVLQARKLSQEEKMGVLRLMEARGFSAHPADWAPDADEAGAPELYAPWAQWRADGLREAPGVAALYSENWVRWSPSRRRVALADMRRRAPEAALALIAEKAGGEPAEQRAQLIEILSIGLHAGDAEYLESLKGDRSKKVRGLAQQFLARLGRGADDDGAAKELADFFTVGRSGLLSRKTVITAAKLKTNAQKIRRAELFERVALRRLSAQFDLPEAELIRAWSLSDQKALSGLVHLVAATGSDAALNLLIDRILEESGDALHLIDPLTARLDEAALCKIRPKLLRLADPQFQASARCMGRDVGAAPLGALEAAPALATLLQEIAEQATDGKTEHQRDKRIEAGLFNLGLLADQKAAAALIDRFAAAGAAPADPTLALLRLNATLERRSA